MEEYVGVMEECLQNYNSFSLVLLEKYYYFYCYYYYYYCYYYYYSCVYHYYYYYYYYYYFVVVDCLPRQRSKDWKSVVLSNEGNARKEVQEGAWVDGWMVGWMGGWMDE